MLDFIDANLEHVLCILILVSRIGDIATTFLVTPNLVLEANPIARRLGWRFALLTLLICAVPYFSLHYGVMVLVPFLMVSASNAGKVWAARAMGEHPYKAMLLNLVGKSKLRHALGGVWVSASFIILLGVVLLLLYPDPDEELAFWFGSGIVTYGIVVAVHGSLWFSKLFKEASAAGGTR